MLDLNHKLVEPQRNVNTRDEMGEIRNKKRGFVLHDL